MRIIMVLRDSRLFLRSLKYVLIIGCILLVGFAGTVMMITGSEAGASKPLTLALVNEDTDSSFSNMVLEIIANNENIASAIEVQFFDEEEAAVTAVRKGAAAALIIPNDFFASVNYGQNYPCKIVLNNSNLSSANTVKYFAGLGSDMLSSAQYAIYEGDIYLADQGADDDTRREYNLLLNTAMISEAAQAPETYFDLKNLGYTAKGLPKYAHYIALFTAFFCGLLSICFFHLYRDDCKKETLMRLFAAGVSKKQYMFCKILFPGICFAVILIGVTVAGGRFVRLFVSPAALICAAAGIAFLAVFCALFGTALGDSSGAVVFIIFFVSMFFTGGIIPYVNLTQTALTIGSFTPLGVVYSLFSPLFGGRFTFLSLVPLAVYLILGVFAVKGELDRTVLGKETV